MPIETRAVEAVLDASGAAAFALPDEKYYVGAGACIAALQRQSARLIAPPLFESEVDSILRRRVYLGVLTPQAAALRVLDALQVEIIYDVATRALARSIGEQLNQIRVYDATYAALAQGRGCDLWTADEHFYNSATDQGAGGLLPFVRFVGTFTTTGGKRIEAVRQEPNSPLVRGFAAWAMESLQQVYETQDIHRAACSQTATAQFWADTDPITPFWETIKESELRAGITKTYLRKQYDIWCEAEGARPLNRPRWAKACESHGLLEERRGTDGTRFWFLPTQPKG